MHRQGSRDSYRHETQRRHEREACARFIGSPTGLPLFAVEIATRLVCSNFKCCEFLRGNRAHPPRISLEPTDILRPVAITSEADKRTQVLATPTSNTLVSDAHQTQIGLSSRIPFATANIDRQVLQNARSPLDGPWHQLSHCESRYDKGNRDSCAVSKSVLYLNTHRSELECRRSIPYNPSSTHFTKSRRRKLAMFHQNQSNQQSKVACPMGDNEATPAPPASGTSPPR